MATLPAVPAHIGTTALALHGRVRDLQPVEVFAVDRTPWDPVWMNRREARAQASLPIAPGDTSLRAAAKDWTCRLPCLGNEKICARTLREGGIPGGGQKKRTTGLCQNRLNSYRAETSSTYLGVKIPVGKGLATHPYRALLSKRTSGEALPDAVGVSYQA